MKELDKASGLPTVICRSNATDSVSTIKRPGPDRSNICRIFQNNYCPLNTKCQDPPQCFNSGKIGHVARNCRVRRAPPMQ